MDSRGYLYMAFGPHIGPFQFCRSARPYDASRWERLPPFGRRATYPSLICDANDTLHCAYRGADRPRKLLYQRRPKSGKWSRARVLVDPAVPDGYTQYGNILAVSDDGVLHLGFHIYDMHPAAGKSLGYLCSRDGGRTWEAADGEAVNLPATPKTNCFIEQGPKLDMRIGGLVVDATGRPWLTAVHLAKRPRSLTLWHHDGSRWRARDLLVDVRKRLPGRGLVGGVLTFDRRGTLYVAATVLGGRAKTYWGHPSLEVVVLTSRDRGKTFAVTPVSKADPARPNWLANIEKPFGPRPIGVPSLMYTHGGPGVGCTGGDPTEAVFVRLMKGR